MGKVVKLSEKDLIAMVTKSLKDKNSVNELKSNSFDIVDDKLMIKFYDKMAEYPSDIKADGDNKVKFHNTVITINDDSILIRNENSGKLEAFSPSEETLNKIKSLVDGVLDESDKESSKEEVIDTDEPEEKENTPDLVSSQLVNIQLTVEGAKLLYDLLTHEEIEFDNDEEKSLADHLIVDLKSVIEEKESSK